MVDAKVNETQTLTIGLRGQLVWRVLRIVIVVLLGWSLLAWLAAKALITNAEIGQADAIVVLSNPSAYVERTGHAAKLWKAGRAPRVVLTSENMRTSWSQAEQRNPYISELATRELRRAGVPADKIEVLPTTVRNTFDEAVQLHEYATENKLQSLLIVTSAYHSRRALWTFRSVFRHSDIAIGLEAVAPGQETPAAGAWWLWPAGWKIVALEYPKLVYYRLRYGLFSEDPGPRVHRIPGPEVKTVVGPGQAGLTLAVAAPVSSYTNEVILIDARKSTGVPNKPQADGSPSITINFGDGFTCNLLACGHAYRKAGVYSITVTARNASGSAGAPVKTTIQVSDIPAAAGSNVIDMSNEQGNKAYYIPQTQYGNATANAAKLQAAIKHASANNAAAEQEILLPAAVFAGPIILTTPVGNKYITIRSNSLSSLPASGNRVGPGHGSLMPVITAPSSTNNILAAMWTPNPAPAVPSHHYRLQGLHFKKDDESRPSQTLMSIGDVNVVQNKISMLPYNFIVDRCWLDGGASDTSQATNGIRIAANAVSVVDSYLGDFRLIGGGVDTAAISLSKGQGPFAFVNNTMVATSENFSISGGPAERNTATISNATTTGCTLSAVTNMELDQNIALPVGGSYSARQTTIIRSISGNNITYDAIPTTPDNGGTAEWVVTPSYIEMRRNYLFKPLRWRRSDPSWNGQDYQIKNLWETKTSRYVVVDGNVMENSWIKDQSYAITITVRNQNGSETPAGVVRELQFSNNIIHNVANGVSILPSDYFGPTQLTSDITFRNNLFWNVGPNWDASGNMMINLLAGGSDWNRTKRVFIVHNTHDNPTPWGTITDFGKSNDGTGATEALWVNNVHGHGAYGFRSNNTNEDQIRNIAEFLPPGSPSAWRNNLIINPAQYANYPSTGIIVSGPYSSQFVNAANGDFSLTIKSPGKKASLDRKDVGVDMAELRAATEGTINGNWTSSPSLPAGSTRPRTVGKP